jgi:hypothetical protein
MLFDYSCLPISTNLDYALLSYSTALKILSNIRGLTDDGVMRMRYACFPFKMATFQMRFEMYSNILHTGADPGFQVRGRT